MCPQKERYDVPAFPPPALPGFFGTMRDIRLPAVHLISFFLSLYVILA